MSFQWLKDLQRLEAGRKPRRGQAGAPDLPLSERYGTEPSPAKKSGPMGSYDLANVRFTGMGSDNKVQPDRPTSINNYTEHEGEVVIPADTVEKLGGPENINSLIEQLGMKKTQDTKGLAGYQQGGVVTPPGETKPGDMTGMKPKDVTKPADASKGMFLAGAGEVENIMRGESVAQKKIADVSREKLAAQQSEELKAAPQEMKQLGITGGPAAAERFKTERRMGEEKYGLESQLAITGAERAEGAAKDVADMGMRGMQLEEQKREFDITTDEGRRRFDVTAGETKRQFDKNMSMTQEKISRDETSNAFNIQWAHYDAALKEGDLTGDYSRAEELYQGIAANPAWAKWIPDVAPDFDTRRSATSGDRADGWTGKIADIIVQNEGDEEGAFGLVKGDIADYFNEVDPNWDTYSQDVKDDKIENYFDTQWFNAHATPDQRALRTLMDNPIYSKYFDTPKEKELATTTISELFRTEAIKIDETTVPPTITTDAKAIMAVWDKPENQHLFHVNPAAVDAEGKPMVDDAGNALYKQPDGTTSTSKYGREGWTDERQLMRETYIKDNKGKDILSIDEWEDAIGKILTDNPDATPEEIVEGIENITTEAGAAADNVFVDLSGSELSTKFFDETGFNGDWATPELFQQWIREEEPGLGKDNVKLNDEVVQDAFKTWAQKASRPGAVTAPITVDIAQAPDNYLGTDSPSYWTGSKYQPLEEGQTVDFKQNMTMRGDEILMPDGSPYVIPAGKYEIFKEPTTGVRYYRNVANPTEIYLAEKPAGAAGASVSKFLNK